MPPPSSPSSPLVFASSEDFWGAEIKALREGSVFFEFTFVFRLASRWPVFWLHTTGGDFIWVSGKGCFCAIHTGVPTGLAKGFVTPGVIAAVEPESTEGASLSPDCFTRASFVSLDQLDIPRQKQWAGRSACSTAYGP